jgi:hypothetical protein
MALSEGPLRLAEFPVTALIVLGALGRAASSDGADRPGGFGRAASSNGSNQIRSVSMRHLEQRH